MLELRRLHKTYEGRPLLTDISFTVATGETVCLLGASGSGKSTLLRMITGLEDPDSGLILFDGLDLATTPSHLRDFGLVFQDYALFPHLSVNENVGFGLKMRRLGGDEISERVASFLHLVNLDRFGDRKIADLSGGEQQRVALARALAIRPRLLMFDEPLGALDRTLRENLLNELRTILHQIPVPAIYVTHDQEEAFALADRVLILHAGRIVRDGKPEEVWGNPGSYHVAEFLGLGNVLEAEVIGGMTNGGWKLRTSAGDFFVRCDHPHSPGEKVHLLVRPQVIEYAGAESGQNDGNALSGAVTDVVFQQDKYKVTLDNGLYLHLKDAPKIGETVSVRIRVECLA